MKTFWSSHPSTQHRRPYTTKMRRHPKIAMNNSIAVILLQENHATNDDKVTIYGYSLIGSINHPKYGIATLVRNDMPATEIGCSTVDSAIQLLTISINREITITNFYKPPNFSFDPPPQYKHPAIHLGDFNCHHTTWGTTPETTMMEKLYMTGLIQSTLSCFMIITNQKSFILLHGTPTRTQI